MIPPYETLALCTLGLLATGVIAGFLSGLFGIGGGIIMVPALFMIGTLYGTEPALAMHVAIGTSLLATVPTAIMSYRVHHRHGAVDKELLRQWALALIMGAFLGSGLGQQIGGKTNTLIFGFFLLLISAYLGLVPAHIKALSHPPKGLGQKIGAGGIGFTAAFVGVGGGILAVPAMLLCNIGMHRAVATSSGVGFFIALSAATVQLSGPFLQHGTMIMSGTPWGTLGYSNVPAMMILALGTMIMAPRGAQLAHKLHAERLRRFFAIMVLCIAMKMVMAGL